MDSITRADSLDHKEDEEVNMEIPVTLRALCLEQLSNLDNKEVKVVKAVLEGKEVKVAGVDNKVDKAVGEVNKEAREDLEAKEAKVGKVVGEDSKVVKEAMAGDLKTIK